MGSDQRSVDGCSARVDAPKRGGTAALQDAGAHPGALVIRAGSRNIDVSIAASAQFKSRRDEPAVVSVVDGWTIHEYSVVTSTNLVAANLPSWTAVRADTQTNGRGRFQRFWVSDQGGLWLSAVVPTERDVIKQRALPLAAGLAVCDSLRELGVSRIRMRWPNDVLVGDRKLAGLLIDHFSPGLAVIGIGINVRNRPEALDPSLRDQTTRLVDLLQPPGACPPRPQADRVEAPEHDLELHELATLVLRHVRLVLDQLRKPGSLSLLLRVNKLWAAPRRVELDLDGTFRGGLFTGVDDEGRLALSDEDGNVTFYDAHEVRHLTEI
jgi:BirA family transcriptional regulator, biotin operon repressor / biotin---[acetyl-CoA-carboxylase] ligase